MGTSPDDIDTPKQGSDRVLLVSVIILMHTLPRPDIPQRAAWSLATC